MATRPAVDPELADADGPLSEPRAKAVLARHGVPIPRGRVIANDSELEAAATGLTFPLALKVVSPTLVHKSDVGGVQLGLTDVDQVREAMRATASLPGRVGWLIEEMSEAGLELVVGGVRHHRFGPMLMVGLGGVLVEVLRDVSLRICPITPGDAESMLASLRSAPLLDGVRGRAGIDRAAVVDVLLRIGGEDGLLMQHADRLAELDINPLIATATGVCAVDASIILAASEEEGTRPPVSDIQRLLQPRAVAVAGASTGGAAQANQYLRNLRAFGYEGAIYAIHPRADEIDGLPAFRSLGDLPQPVDYAYIAVAAERCAPLLAQAQGKVPGDVGGLRRGVHGRQP
jgi:acyl-CoA synthetase (NDP forming)